MTDNEWVVHQPQPTRPPTMADMNEAIAKLGALGFPRARQTVHCGDVDRLRDWVAAEVPQIDVPPFPQASSIFGLAVLPDVTLPPDVVEIREGDRVMSRMVLPPVAQTMQQRAEIEDIGRMWGAP